MLALALALLLVPSCATEPLVDGLGTPAGNGTIVFVRSRGRVAELMTIDPETGVQHAFGPLTGTKDDPAWSPDGTRLAFVWRRWPSGFNVFVMDADGEHPRRITGGPWIEGTPTWSPDGDRLAFSSNRGPGVRFGIYLTRLDGGEPPRRITSGLAPDWSPEGTAIVFERLVDGASDVFVSDPAGGRLGNLTRSPADDRDPDWSPDGDSIVFASDRDGDLDLYVMDADGSDMRRLTDQPGDERWPEWAPDGTVIAYARRTPTTSEIWLVSASGGRPTRLTSGPWFDTAPTWRPLRVVAR
jgi:TolB protein